MVHCLFSQSGHFSETHENMKINKSSKSLKQQVDVPSGYMEQSEQSAVIFSSVGYEKFPLGEKKCFFSF